MATNLSEFYGVLRAVLNDPDEDVPVYTSEQLDAAMEAVLNLGKVVSSGGAEFSYEAGPPKALTPDLTAAGSPAAYGSLIWNTSKLFVQGLRRESFRTRSFSNSVGPASDQILGVLNELYDLEQGDMVA